VPIKQAKGGFAPANGFPSFELLLSASRRVAAHDRYEHFIAVCPDGREFVWDEDERPRYGGRSQSNQIGA
jgi:hypothetical protein